MLPTNHSSSYEEPQNSTLPTTSRAGDWPGQTVALHENLVNWFAVIDLQSLSAGDVESMWVEPQ